MPLCFVASVCQGILNFQPGITVVYKLIMIEINKIRLCNLTHSRLGSTFK